MKQYILTAVLLLLSASVVISQDNNVTLGKGKQLDIAMGIWASNSSLRSSLDGLPEASDIKLRSDNVVAREAYIIEDRGNALAYVAQMAGKKPLGGFMETSIGAKTFSSRIGGDPLNGSSGINMEYQVGAIEGDVLTGLAKLAFGDDRGDMPQIHDIEIYGSVPSDKAIIAFYIADGYEYAIVVDPTIIDREINESDADEEPIDDYIDDAVKVEPPLEVEVPEVQTRPSSSRF